MKFFVPLVATLFAEISQAYKGEFPTRHLVSRRIEEEEGQQRPWWDLGLADDILNEVGLYYLGQAYYAAADIGEVLETFSRVNASDPWSWSVQWRKTANRLEGLAKESSNAGNHRSAGHFYLRAATYRRAALHRHPDPFHDDVNVQAQLCVDAFESFLTEFDYPCQSVKIPYEDTALPGYLCINPSVKGPAPTIIFQEGKDGWAEDGKFVVDEALPRGYNVLLFDGPGIGKVMRLQGLPFRHDWENVITPIVDYLVQIDEVDEKNVALIAVSLGGYLGPRAAAYEHRLKALIANPGVLDWGDVYRRFLEEINPNLLTLYETDPELFDETLYQYMEFSSFLEWGMKDSMWHHGKTTPFELMKEVELFNNRDIVENITACTFIIDAENETRGHSLELYESLTKCEQKEYIMFTADEAAQFHVQPGATAILSARMFNWLDGIFETESENSEVALKNAAEKNVAFYLPILKPAFIVASAAMALVIMEM